MGRKFRFELSQLNIVTHPHSPESYKRLFERASNQNIIAKYYGAKKCMIATVKPLPSDEVENCIYGSFFTFSELDFTEDWLNLENLDAIDPADSTELNIPTHLKPELRAFRYIMDLKTHNLIYESKNTLGQNMSPRHLERALKGIFSAPSIVSEFGRVEVTVIPETEALDKILSMHNLNTLNFRVVKPNPDEDDYEDRLFARMEAQNIRSREETLKKEQGEQSIKPDEDTLKILNVAKDNGFVEGLGKNAEGGKEFESTKSHPKKRTIYFNKDRSPLSVIASKVQEWLR